MYMVVPTYDNGSKNCATGPAAKTPSPFVGTCRLSSTKNVDSGNSFKIIDCSIWSCAGRSSPAIDTAVAIAFA